MIDSGLGWLNRYLSGRGSARAEDAQGTPTQSHISPSIPQHTKIICTLKVSEDAARLKKLKSANELAKKDGKDKADGKLAFICFEGGDKSLCKVASSYMKCISI